MVKESTSNFHIPAPPENTFQSRIDTYFKKKKKKQIRGTKRENKKISKGTKD